VAVQDWSLMWAGRAVFGIGTETMCVSARLLVADWFMVRSWAV
jgi:hypothetical protein